MDKDRDEPSDTSYVLEVSMRRASVPPTSDQALWVIIRNSVDAISYSRFERILDDLLSPKAERRHISWLCLLLIGLAFALGLILGLALS